MEEKISFLTKLAAEVANESKSGESKPEGSKSDAKKDGKKPPFPPKGDGEKKQPEKDNGGKPPFPPKGNGEEGSDKKSGNNEKGNENGEEKAVGGEKEIPGNESGEGAAVPGSATIDPTAVFDFFAQNPAPNDDAYHEFAETNGFDVHAAEAAAYALAGKYIMFLRGGKSQGLDPNSVDPEQLKMGIEIESEHSSDPTTCKKIALDHLAENPQYYTALQQMEASSGSQEEKKPEEGASVEPQKDERAKGQQTTGGEGSMRS